MPWGVENLLEPCVQKHNTCTRSKIVKDASAPYLSENVSMGQPKEKTFGRIGLRARTLPPEYSLKANGSEPMPYEEDFEGMDLLAARPRHFSVAAVVDKRRPSRPDTKPRMAADGTDVAGEDAFMRITYTTQVARFGLPRPAHWLAERMTSGRDLNTWTCIA